jgi:DNA-binding MurR/RpiR family transcriptional regulator
VANLELDSKGRHTPYKAAERTSPPDMAPRGPGRIDLFAVLHEQMSELSRSHRAIARYIVSHIDETAFLTAANLAKRCGTSEATAIRFAQALGFPGFPEFQAHVRILVREKLGPGEKMKRTEPIPSHVDELLAEATEKAIANIRETSRIQTPAVLTAAARTIIDAKTVYVVGLRGSAGTAQTYAFFLNQIRPDVRGLTEGGPVLLESLVSLSDVDMILAISVPRYTRWTIDALRFARKRGAKTVVITDSTLSPAAQLSNIVLVAQIDAFFSNSYAPVLLLLDVLAASIFSLAPEAAHDRLDAIEEVFRGHDFFFSKASLLKPAARGRTMRRRRHDEVGDASDQ